MRIIAGSLKGRRLLSPDSHRIRPTSDMVKEAMFSMIAPYLNSAVVIDLFSGTGNLGLEALSRGARLVFFGDKSKESLSLIIRNIESCGTEDRSVVLRGDWKQVLRRIGERADIIFLDPPYEQISVEEVIREIHQLALLDPAGVIVAEHGERQMLPDQIGTYEKMKEKKYGNKKITLYTADAKEN